MSRVTEIRSSDNVPMTNLDTMIRTNSENPAIAATPTATLAINPVRFNLISIEPLQNRVVIDGFVQLCRLRPKLVNPGWEALNRGSSLSTELYYRHGFEDKSTLGSGRP